MEAQNISVRYAATISDIVSVNSSFDKGVLKIAYHGQNRNGSNISRSAFERSAPTLAYCPVVVNYDVEDDSMGGHDVEIVNTDAGVRMINMTDPVGVVPKECAPWFEIIDDNGTEHEYFCTDVLLWKRQAAYDKIKRNGITAQSMEITVKDGRLEDGIYYIDNFEFTALTLLNGDEDKPCFESAALQMFSMENFKKQYAEMMSEFKANFSSIQPSAADVDITTMKGGKSKLEDKMALLAEFNLKAEDLDFSIEDLNLEELRAKFEAMQNADPAPAAEPEAAPTFSLTGEQLIDEICETLRSVKMQTEWGDEWSRYWFCDYTLEPAEVFFEDCEDWHIYGAPFSMNGDHVVVDFDNMKRKKICYVDFDEGEQPLMFSLEEFAKAVMSGVQAKDSAAFELERAQMQQQIDSLAEFKLNKEAGERKAAETALFEKFSELADMQEFNDLKANCAEMTLETIEEKCYALIGRKNMQVKFSVNEPQDKGVKVPVEHHEVKEEPYGGAYSKYLKK